MERQRGACAKPRASRWVLRHAPCEKTRGPEIKENVSLDSCHDTCRYDICRPDTCRPDFSDPIFADTNTCRYDTCRSDICRSDFCRLDPFRSLLYLTYTPWSVCCCGGIILRQTTFADRHLQIPTLADMTLADQTFADPTFADINF
uniref:Uncharacterized protein n=1 Tax=Meloidogyne incognita TaxID=6306 RepID=A0A914M4Y3_MELIC